MVWWGVNIDFFIFLALNHTVGRGGKEMGFLFFSKKMWPRETEWQRVQRWLATATGWVLILGFFLFWLWMSNAKAEEVLSKHSHIPFVPEKESSSFIYTDELFREGLEIMKEAERICPTETFDEEEVGICTILDHLTGAIDERILEDITNKEKVSRLLIVRGKVRELLSGDCCLIWRAIKDLPPSNQDWTKGF